MSEHKSVLMKAVKKLRVDQKNVNKQNPHQVIVDAAALQKIIKAAENHLKHK